ncbi:hypothetical protein K438DRAFT_1837504 [Mycena galopus ATCC 62051]|nr:hypothetical protein K438DRAFT_1837504 [Mycena galopus ATCC 62051]
MGVQENLLVYVDVIRHIEKLGGSQGHANNEEAFIPALKQGLLELLPEDDNHAVAILKLAAKPREIGTPEDEKEGRQRYFTFREWLVGLESLGGSKGFEDFLKENPTGIAPAVSEAEHKDKTEPVRLWQQTADVCWCSLIDAAFYNWFKTNTQGHSFAGSKWCVEAGEVPWTLGEISYNNPLFARTKKAGVNITGLGLVGDYYDSGNSWVGQSICGAGGEISMIVTGTWS